MDRVLVVDKPSGLTSHDVVERIRRSSRVKRVGHTGTLDPSATGVLVVLVGKATRLAQFLVDVDKEYRGHMILGATTDTQDAEGKVVSRGDWAGVTENDVESAFARFRGTIEQVPPMVSAIKHEGTPLYLLARRGVVVEREPRSVVIRKLRLIDFDPPAIEFEVACSKGTYVRTLAADIGRALGCGAHLGKLRRVRVGEFAIEQAARLEDVERLGTGVGAIGFSMFDAMAPWPALRVTPDEEEIVLTGGAVAPDAARLPGEGADFVRMTSDGRSLLALGKVVRGEKQAGGTEIVVRPVRVFAAG